MKIASAINLLKIIFFFPLFFIYLILCFIFPLIRIGKIKHEKGIFIFISKDLIHADYLIESKYFKDLFSTNKKYVKIGWGDRKIFLETQNWKDLKFIDLVNAFFGLNKTVLRVEHVDNFLPEYKKIELNEEQLNLIKNHIIKSYKFGIIEKRKEYYQNGDYYESNLNYNCITNCNNWINLGLRKANISNRIWCPITYYF